MFLEAIDNPGWLVGLCVATVTFQLFRLSIDLIQTASAATSKDYATNDPNKGSSKKKKKDKDNKGASSYGSMAAGTSSDDGKSEDEDGDEDDTAAAEEGEATPLLDGTEATSSSSDAADAASRSMSRLKASSIWSFRFQLLLILFLLGEVFKNYYGSTTKKSESNDNGIDDSGDSGVVENNTNPTMEPVLPVGLIWTSIFVISIGAILTRRDVPRNRFGIIQRFLYLCSTGTLYMAAAMLYYHHRTTTTFSDELVMNIISLYGIVSLVEVPFIELPSSRHPPPTATSNLDESTRPGGGLGSRKRLSSRAILTLLKPYFWPDATSESALINRIRAILTWVCVILSKVCNLVAPILLGWASTALAHEQYTVCIRYSIGYAIIGLFGSAFKEGQSVIYLKVAQAAFVQLSETTFVHLHTLSLDWHLRKKLGEVIRSMDRGIAACDTLMKWLFLSLVPTLTECIVVCIIFATYFAYVPLAITVFYFVWFYIVWTIVVTLWRKKFRKAVVQSDNEWHDRCTDSLINFETVKYFTAEEHEAKLFGDSVKRYQQGSVDVQASLSFLNVSQKAILQSCLATALSMAAWGIKQRIDCCLDLGCEAGVSDCCQAIDAATCPGMEVGDFVAVLTYTLQLFQPLNFLGSIYNGIVMAIIDLTNLSDLLAESPDVTDGPNAITLPRSTVGGHVPGDEYMQSIEDDIAVEFDNVVFHYPTQSDNKGLKGVSFTMKRGTTTAVVGPTGAGKTTISRLFFRFYDVLGGSIKVNGIDVRNVTQKSLRGSIGVVPQSASMFNDTVRTNLLYGRRNATQEELEQAARDAQLLDFILELEEGWDTVVGDRGLKLSGGEKQRAAIARCLLKDPPFVLLDEATSALDTLTENSVQEALDRLGSERTVLVIAHRLGTIRNADNILVLKDGLVAEQGTHDELLEKDGVYAEMWNMQLHSNTGSRAPSQDSLKDLS